MTKEIEKILLYLSGFLAVASILFAYLTVFSPGTLDNLGLTGFATAGNQTIAKVNLTVQSAVIINFSIDSIDWGTGRVDAGQDNATLDTSQNFTYKVQRGNWTGWFSSKVDGFQIDNIGNVNVTLFLKFNLNSTQLLGGVRGGGPEYNFNLTAHINHSNTVTCMPPTNFSLWNWTRINASFQTSDGYRVCNNFTYYTNKSRLRLDVRLVVPADSRTGYLEDNITATAIQSA